MELIAEQQAAARQVGATQRHRGQLFRKYFLLILALVCGALLISGGIGLYFTYQQHKEELATLQREKAAGAAARIEEFLRQIEQQLAFAASPQLGAGGLEQRRIEFLKLLRMVPEVTDVAQIDPKGREQLSVSRLKMDVAAANEDRSQEPAFKNARPGQTWFGRVHFRTESEPYVSIAVRSGGEAGPVTVAEVNLKFMWDVITRIRIGQKGKAYVVDGAGYLIADPDIGLVLRKTDLSGLQQVKAALAPGADGSLALLAKDFAGNRVLTAYAPIEPGREKTSQGAQASLGWKVFVEQPVAEVYAALDATILRTVVLIVAGLVFSAMAAVWLARSMARPINVLQEGAQRIGAGDLEQKIDVHTGDELEALADQFNRMTEQLRQSYAGLERKVKQRTAELQQTLEQQTATSQILRVISDSPSDVNPILDAVAERATRLCDSTSTSIYVVEGQVLRRTAFNGPEALIGTETLPYTPETLTGRTIAEGRAIHVHDIERERETYPRSWEFAQKYGHHTMLAVPLLREGRPFGAMFLRRTEVRPFSDKQIALSKTFADQAAIGIENVRLFKEIREKSAQLEVANKHKSDFLANMSHELRTPLNAIIGFSEVLMDRMFGEVNEKQADYLNDIHESGRHLLSLINDILDLSKIEAGRMDLEISSFDLPTALENAMTLIRERAQRHGIELSLDVDRRLGVFQGDERKFKQIMLNLLSNAVKFTPDGGRVDVSARKSDGKIEVTVRDTGIGIAPEDQAAVFEEFKQVGGDYTKKAEGTGLGLALTKRFVELHGGEVRLESAPGKGSIFSVALPIRH